MKHQETCNNCVDPNGKLLECSVRNKCCDDASTTKRRKQILTPWPENIE